jgi:hypothetical protein
MKNQVNQSTDLFQSLELLPDTVQECINQYAQSEQLNYQECKEFQSRLESMGYTFDYSLDATPFNLRKIN